MKAVVIYSSKRGATKRYAEWIAEELECDCIPLAACDLHSLEQFDVIVYGGWLRGSGIVGFDKMKSAAAGMVDRLVVFCDGIAKNTPDNFMQIMDINLDEDMKDVPLIFLKGAYDPAKVTGMDRIMMMFAKHIVVSGNAGGIEGEEDANSMKDMIEHGVDMVDRESIESVLKAVRRKTE